MKLVDRKNLENSKVGQIIRKHKLSKVLTFTAISLLVAVGTALTLYFSTDIPAASANYSHEINQAQKNGLIVDKQTYIRKLDYPKGENGADDLLPFFEKHKKLQEKYSYGFNSAAYFQELRPDFYLLDQALSKDRCVFRRNFDRFDQEQKSQLTSMFLIAQMMSLQSEYAIYRGDLEEAKLCWRYLTFFTRAAGEDISLLGFTTSTAVRGLLLGSLVKAIDRRQSNPEWVDAIAEVISKIESSLDLKLALQMTACLELEKIDSLIGGELTKQVYSTGTGEISRRQILIYRAIPRMRAASKARVLEFYNYCVENIPEDPNKIQKFLQSLNAIQPSPAKGMSYVLPFLTIPNEIGELYSLSQYQTIYSLLKIAIKALQHPELPIDRLGASQEIDLDGKPIRIKSTKTSLLIYSVSYNMIDDGGSTRLDRWQRPFDWVVEISLSQSKVR